ncbi:MAG: RAMP superfamily CRISPR-associated protein [Candidatus Diapherotrites archaeon]
MPTLELRLEIEFLSKWHSGSGEGGLSANRLIRRDARGWPFIPASTLKGVIREQCEKLCRTLAEKYWLPLDPHERDLRRPGAFAPLSQAPSPVETIFGTNYEEGGLFFRDAYLIAEPYQDHFYQTRTRLHRLLGTAKEQHLFTTEYALPQTFTTTITGYHRHRTLAAFQEGDLPYAYCLLVAGILSVEFLGSDKSSGSGGVRLHIPTLNYKGQTREVEEVFEYLDRDYIADSFPKLSE